METMTFEDVTLLFVSVMAVSMVLGGLAFWTITAIKECLYDEEDD